MPRRVYDGGVGNSVDVIVVVIVGVCLWWQQCGCESGGNSVGVVVVATVWLWWLLCGCASGGNIVGVIVVATLWV